MKYDRILRAAAAFMVFAAAIPGQAQQAAGLTGPRVLGLEECIRLGTASGAEMRAAALEIGAADARVSEARGQFFPSISVQGGYARLSEVTPGSITSEIDLPAPIGTQEVTVSFPPSLQDSTSLRVSVQQPVFTGLRIISSLQQAAFLRTAAGEDLKKTANGLCYSIREAYWSLAKAKALEQAAREGVSQFQARLADAEKLFDQEMTTRNDTLQARLALEEATIALASATALRSAAKARLAQLVGLEWNADIDTAEVSAGQMQASPLPPLEAQVSRALGMRPELHGAHSRISAQEAAVDAAVSGLYPSVYVTGECTIANPNSRVFPQTDRFTGTWSAGIFATLDIGRFPSIVAQADQARARLSQAKEAERGLADAIALEVVRARLQWEEAAGKYAALGRETAELEENDRVVRERFHQGVAISSEAQDARVSAVRARLRETATLCDLFIAQAAMEKAMGE